MGLCSSCPEADSCPYIKINLETISTSLEEIIEDIQLTNLLNFKPIFDISVNSCSRYNELKI